MSELYGCEVGDFAKQHLCMSADPPEYILTCLANSRGFHSNRLCAMICNRSQNRPGLIFDLTIDFCRVLVLTTDLVPYIFTIFLCTTYLQNFDQVETQLDHCTSGKISLVC